MDQRAKDTKTEILDISVPVQGCTSIALHHPEINQNKKNLQPVISDQELKVRGELEMEIERDLEREIKDGIHHLAFRLLRLYHHQKERTARELFESGAKNLRERRNKTPSEVNINIKLEGGTKIEIKETKRDAPGKGRPRTASSDNLKGTYDTGKKFDWANSLRSDKGSTAIYKRITERSNHGKAPSHDIGGVHVNGSINNARGSPTSSSGHRKEIGAPANKKVLTLGWKW